jgi:hypothetical protein
MCPRPTRWILLVLTAAVAGCGANRAANPLPALDDVVKVRLTEGHFPIQPGKNDKDFCDVTFTERADIAGVLDWLGSIDWSQEGMDLTPVGMPQPDGSITLTTKDGSNFDFGYYWDRRIINGRANRLYQVADISGLRKITDKACK